MSSTGEVLVPGGPRVVAIGGGHGLARSLGAARRYAGAIAAVVSVADDGGSSGRLREALGIPAPGDVRRCISALLPGRSVLGDSLEHRFSGGELEGHAFGNLLIAALSASSGGFVEGIAETCSLLSTLGRVLPATVEPVTLRAEAAEGDLAGQVRIMKSSGIRRLSLDPLDATATPAALEAIAEADQLVIGPGSLYTSVLAALAPDGMSEAIAKSGARVIYVANLAEQVETTGYDVAEHVTALLAHGVVPDVVLADTNRLPLGCVAAPTRLVLAELAPTARPVHDVERLAEALADLSDR